MLSCKEITDNASAYLDRELPFTTRMSFRMHLFMCRHCRRFVHNFRAGIGMVQKLHQTRTQTPAEEAEQLSRQIRQRAASPSSD